jgi:hypothetical protein
MIGSPNIDKKHLNFWKYDADKNLYRSTGFYIDSIIVEIINNNLKCICKILPITYEYETSIHKLTKREQTFLSCIGMKYEPQN